MACNGELIIRLSTIDSTNRYLRDEASELWNKRGDSSFVVATAEYQTAGRGQRGNIWNSNAGENLLFSILVRPGETLAVSEQFVLSQAVALALHDTMLHYGIDVRLKWPNDIYVGNKKLAGVLVELDCCGAFVELAIIGIGININQESFPVMDRIPVSMKVLQGREFVLDNVLETVLESFSNHYSILRYGDRESITTRYTELLLGLNEQCTFIDKDGRFEAVIEGVEPYGHLIVRRSDGGLSRYAFKEVEQLL